MEPEVMFMIANIANMSAWACLALKKQVLGYSLVCVAALFYFGYSLYGIKTPPIIYTQLILLVLSLITLKRNL